MPFTRRSLGWAFNWRQTMQVGIHRLEISSRAKVETSFHGTSGDSANIIWSQANVEYDAYNQYTVTATASQTAVTVFVRATVSTPVMNNDIYVDDASLTVGSSSAPTG